MASCISVRSCRERRFCCPCWRALRWSRRAARCSAERANSSCRAVKVAGGGGNRDLAVELRAEPLGGFAVLRGSGGFDGAQKLAGLGDDDLRVVPGVASGLSIGSGFLVCVEHLLDQGGVFSGVGILHVACRGPGDLFGVSEVGKSGFDIGDAEIGYKGAGVFSQLVGFAGQVAPYAGEVGDSAEQGVSRGGYPVELIPRQLDGLDELLDGRYGR